MNNLKTTEREMYTIETARKRPSNLVRLQYFHTHKIPSETQRSLEDSVLRNASR